MRLAVLMPVGPGEREVARAADTVASVLHHEPGIASVCLVDDDPTGRDLAAALAAPGRPLLVLPNPRAGRGAGLWGGLAAGVLAGLGHLHREVAPDAVVKLDTDALVVAPFGDAVAAALADPGVGMAGTARTHCDGSPRSLGIWPKSVGRRAVPVRPFRTGEGVTSYRLQQALWGPAAVLRRRITAARRNGYRDGEHCLGGSYAVPRALLDRMAVEGWYDDWSAWVPFDIGEDVCLGVYVGAAGLSIVDANRPGQPFGVEHTHLPAPPEDVVREGWSIVHSVKDQPGRTEAEIRAYFAGLRS